jgi:uncharacterized protein (UPF0332 family)/predicted nucleotidyltransferase
VKTASGIDYLADIEKFKDALVKSDIGRQIAKIIWFGSTLKKTDQEDSDVDILIIIGDGEMVRDRIADVLLDFQMTQKSPLEIVTSNIDELYPITDYFLKNVLTYGPEVYSMPEEELKLAAADHYLSLSQEYYESAKDAIERGHHRLGLDGAYNSAELAVKGLLVLKIADIPGSHGGIAQNFGELYVKSGAIGREVGRKLNRCLDFRNAARYKFTAIVTREDSELVLGLARDLISFLEEKPAPK